MKQIPVQVMRFPVIAHIEAQHLITPIKELLGERQDIQRLRATFPAVQYDGRTPRTVRRTRDVALQSYPIAAVEDHFLLCSNQARRTTCDRPSTRAGAGQHRLNVPVAQPAGRLKVFVRSERHSSISANAARLEHPSLACKVSGSAR